MLKKYITNEIYNMLYINKENVNKIFKIKISSKNNDKKLLLLLLLLITYYYYYYY